MPRFTTNGPVVPDLLVQELEEDRGIIFCGAGISMGAGLPSYNELVRHCYSELGQPIPNKRHSDWLWPDRMLGALENKMTPLQVRRVAALRLSQEPTTLDLHKALLRLALLRRVPGHRLVTTNFDHLFEKAQDNLRLGYEYHSGPIVPIPRNDRTATWHSIVYLHGRLAPAEEDNSHLVLTSADFGRAYLTDGWGARFVARLFSDFTVLFVGYSLNDPVLRYMTDAFAAEDAQARAGKSRGPAYIFVPFRGQTPDPRPFRDRKLEPIFYDERYRHIHLKRTLIEWARTREDYLSNVQLMVSQIAPIPPEALDPSATNNLLWAVLARPEDRGHGARVFAKLDPLPKIQWLYAFEKREEELNKAHLAAMKEAQEAEQALPLEPLYTIRELFPIGEGSNLSLSPTADAIIHWLIRHLNSADLVEWTISKMQGGHRPHSLLRYEIRRHLAENSSLPGGFRRFWHIVSSEGGWAVRSKIPSYPRWNLAQALRAERGQPWVREELIGALTPYLVFNRSLYRQLHAERDPEAGTPIEGTTLAQIADAEVVLAGEEYLAEVLEAVASTEAPDAFWAGNIEILTAQLRRVFELFETAGEANVDLDPSALERPSIVPHDQNRYHSSWAQLFDLLWRGWVNLDATNAEESRQQILTWQRIPYLGFKRLMLAAVQHTSHFTVEEKLEMLLNG